MFGKFVFLTYSYYFMPWLNAQNSWVSGFLGHPKMVTETQILEQVFRLETQGLWGWWKTLYLGFLTGNQETVREIQILGQVFRTETQILIVISSPDLYWIVLNFMKMYIVSWLWDSQGTNCLSILHGGSDLFPNQANNAVLWSWLLVCKTWEFH